MNLPCFQFHHHLSKEKYRKEEIFSAHYFFKNKMTSRQPNPRHKTSIIFLAITVSVSIFILFVILYSLYYLWYFLVQRSRTIPFDSASPLSKLQRFSFKELNQATNNFSESNLIGKGGSGTVFRGILKDGKLVAVKFLDSNSLQFEQEFQNELKILGGLKPFSFVVSLLGFCVEKGKRVLVYEYMPNKSLQESLFSENANNSCLNWGIRFSIILDVAKALSFLHLECDPAVVHGDVKPSNVLLDSEFRAKLSDFGLSRVKIEGEFGVDLFSQDLGKSQELSENSNLGVLTPLEGRENGEVDFALALQASKNKGKELSINENIGGVDCNKYASYDNELSSIDHSKELNSTQWGEEWWWRQDGSGELCSKDYVKEWIGSQISPSSTPEWDQEKGTNSNIRKNLENRVQEIKFKKCSKPVRAKKHRKMHDWWQEEDVKDANTLQERSKRRLKVPHFGLGKRFLFTRKKSFHENRSENLELSFKKGRKKKNSPSVGSGDFFSRELSSTTSMRGTLCYIAPEYGGCGYLMEKGDIYSLGVLILVIVSGRRPLHVLSSPMKLEKANLVSWCRHLSRAGNVLEIVDERLENDYDKEQARLCIDVALACLQKVPELRPEIGEIVKVLRGEMEIMELPFEFSPSPPSKFMSRSRRK